MSYDIARNLLFCGNNQICMCSRSFVLLNNIARGNNEISMNIRQRAMNVTIMLETSLLNYFSRLQSMQFMELNFQSPYPYAEFPSLTLLCWSPTCLVDGCKISFKKLEVVRYRCIFYNILVILGSEW